MLYVFDENGNFCGVIISAFSVDLDKSQNFNPSKINPSVHTLVRALEIAAAACLYLHHVTDLCML